MIFHAVAFAFDEDGFSVVQEAIENGGGEGAVVVEDFGPVFVGSVGGDDHGALLVAKADDLEEEIGAMLVDGQKTQLVANEQRGCEVFLELGFEAIGRFVRRTGC